MDTDVKVVVGFDLGAHLERIHFLVTVERRDEAVQVRGVIYFLYHSLIEIGVNSEVGREVEGNGYIRPVRCDGMVCGIDLV